MIDLHLQPVIPIWLIVGLLVLGLVGLWLTSRQCLLSSTHRLALAAIRVAALLILAALLLQPELLRERVREEAPSLAVVVDTSASMMDTPGETGGERAEQAVAYLRSKAFRDLADTYRLHAFELGGDLTGREELAPDQLAFNAPRTHLVDGLNELGRRLRGTNLAGVVLLSDGLDQSTSDLLPEGRRVPIFVPELTPPQRTEPSAGREVRIAEVVHPERLVVDWKGQVEVTVRRRGEGRLVCPVHLARRGERIRSGYVTFEPGQQLQQITFSIEPTRVGRTTYRIDIEPPGDTTPDDNSRQFIIDVTDPKNRLLYLEGTPRWEFKFVKRALMQEKNMYISAFVQSGNGIFINFAEDSAASTVGELPTFTRERLLDYRVIILGEMSASALQEDQQQAIVDYVESGGGLLFLGSARAYGADGWPAASIMEPLLPFQAGETVPRLAEGHLGVVPTDVGRTHPVLSGLAESSGFPAILSLWGPVVPRPLAVSLLEAGDGSPVLLTQRLGEGRVAAVLSDSLWRWQLGAPAALGERSLYDRFLSQLVHWLAPSEEEVQASDQLQLFTAGTEAEVRQPVTIGAVFGLTEELRERLSLSATIRLPDGRELIQPLTAGQLGADVGLSQELAGWRTTFEPTMPGAYEIVVETSTGEREETVIIVAEPQLELTGLPVNRDYLRQLAEQTGGGFAAHGEWDKLLLELPYEPLIVRTTSQTPLWNQPWILILLMALFLGEWYLRGKLDLV